MTSKRLLNQRRPVLCHGFTLTGMSRSKRPSLLSQTRTESNRSPREPSRWSGPTTLSRVAMASPIESGEKSTPWTLQVSSSLIVKTCSYVFASHTITPSKSVPAAIASPVLRHNETDAARAELFHSCYLFAVIHSPHAHSDTVATAHDIFPVC